ncbi:MAG: Uma2 family endonuclease [Pseudanabaenaceae cyanobacterium]|jgi:Uma2 family endonuclease
MIAQIETPPETTPETILETSPETPRIYSPAEYLAMEVESEARHEYINGEIIAMSGGTPNHNQIVLNIAGTLNFALKRQPYRVFVTDQRLWIPQQRVYTYPDVMVVNGDLVLQEGRKDTITNPMLIVEVLSKSTGNYDQSEKFAFYRTIPTFQEYLLVDQYTCHVQQYSKIEPKKWSFQEYDSLEDIVTFASVSLTLALTEIYDKVELEMLESEA